MTSEMKAEIVASITNFKLPAYSRIPDTGLYLDQVAQYISDYLAPLENIVITGSMISNYVKKELITNPVRKQYNRDQIAYLIFISIAKMVLSLEDLFLFIQLQKKTYGTQKAYDYFCEEFENVLQFVFGIKDTLDTVGTVPVEESDEKQMLRNMIITAAYKIYLDKCFSRLKKDT